MYIRLNVGGDVKEFMRPVGQADQADPEDPVDPADPADPAG